MRTSTKWLLGLLLLVLLSALPMMAIQAQELQQTATPVPTATFPVLGGDNDDDREPVVIEYGETAEGELTNDHPTMTFEFEGDAGDTVTIAMQGGFDTYLVLQDEEGFELTYDDDSGGNLTSRITAYELPYDGTYYIVAQSYNYRTGGPGVSGAFTVSVGITEVRNIEYTQEVEGELSSSEPSALFRFSGDAGDLVAVTVISDSFVPYVVISDPDGYQFAYSDYYNTGRVATVGPISLYYSGNYTITVTNNSGSPAAGSFTLMVDRIELTPVEFDEDIEVELDEGLPAYFSFEAEAGELINVRVNSNDSIDTRIDILDPSGYSIYSDDDSGAGFDPEVNRLVISQTGVYTIVLRPFADSGEGTVTMVVSRAEVPSLDDGPQTLELGEKQQRGVVTFEAEAGQEYTIVFSDLNGAQPYITITQEGYTITTVSSGAVNGLSVTIVAPNDGAVQIQIEDYSYANISMTISLAEADE